MKDMLTETLEEMQNEMWNKSNEEIRAVALEFERDLENVRKICEGGKTNENLYYR